MNTLTKLALGMLGHLHGQPVAGESLGELPLPAADTTGGLPLMQALRRRHSAREFSPEALTPQELSNVLWVAAGINRTSLGGRTAPSALNAQEVDLYVALPQGLYRYEAPRHTLLLMKAEDVRQVTGYQDFVDTAPLDLIFVADHSRMKMVPASSRESFASVAAGAMAQNVYLWCASAGLATVVRAWFDRSALMHAMQLTPDQQILLTQTVGRPPAPPA
ncbi:MAG TPA: SagB/ThcOx family dehydrogenase [Hydrogenophaga sp.]|uniref:SagB/ThcOx family dehydrogenase n=1 Tax=Hydrogenophaga sp. TaxID=1904254 RepID=UPI002B7D6602|nr:SagB/ThcOx family dehydrogenase [Hydrogenophaga sp.]HMN91883.1 SagB/ThcOx family dehydrogenase [Hydrogenophaga sp.]HMP08977.1 SagB/ThcOx family dehydrogenase [Hydrogenophaga sp.]